MGGSRYSSHSPAWGGPATPPSHLHGGVPLLLPPTWGRSRSKATSPPSLMAEEVKLLKDCRATVNLYSHGLFRATSRNPWPETLVYETFNSWTLFRPVQG